MQVVYGPAKSHNNYHLAGPGDNHLPGIMIGWGVMLETDEERELLRDYMLPFSSISEASINLEALERLMEMGRRRKGYRELPTEKLREGLVGAILSYVWTDFGGIGGDFRRPDTIYTRGFSISVPEDAGRPGIEYPSGLGNYKVLSVEGDRLILDGGGWVQIPDGSFLAYADESEAFILDISEG